ncbi:MAG TPA: peptidoglycan-binding protein [Acidimicrobiales bacterium]|nr:peptidoglycan-binding protein [Acidimicrobiales bacterium]
MNVVTAGPEPGGRGERRSRRRLTTGIAVVAAVVIAGGAIVMSSMSSGSTSHRAVNAIATTTATIQRTDVAETTPVNGTVGFANPHTIVQPAGMSAQAVAQAQLSVAQAEANLVADRAALPAVKVFADQLALNNAQSALASAQAAATAYDPTSKYTALPAAGEVISPGRALWSVDGEVVPLLPGTLAPWRAFRTGMTDGADVAALDQALIDLGDGDGLSVSATFTPATTAAIDRLQESLGLPRTGSLALGSVVFEPAALRVTAVHPLVGGTVAGGQPVLDVTTTTPVVNVALPVDQTARVRAGDPVSVNLPDGATATGTITAVGTVAANTTVPNSGSNTTSATVNVTVSLTNASPAGSLDQAPVTVNITNTSAHQVLVVPTTALLALAGGGYAVELVRAGGAHQLIGVTTGIFDDQSGMVQVSGPGLAVGQRVVVAA